MGAGVNVLIAGGSSGSWAIRGQQLGMALGARVAQAPTEHDLQWADRVVLLKGSAFVWAERVRGLAKPIVWDALDFWKQPGENGWTQRQAESVLQDRLAFVQPRLAIGATEAMARLCGAYLPHHARPGLTARPVRDAVQMVAYEGSVRYLGQWRDRLVRSCHDRGWHFRMNPESLAEADLVVTFRDAEWDGWPCRRWKSGVKLINAMTAQRPVIGHGGAAFEELQPEGSIVESPDDLETAFDHWADPERRRAAADRLASRSGQWTLAIIAAQYRTLLESLE